MQSQVDQLRIALANEQSMKDALKKERDAAKEEAEKVMPKIEIFSNLIVRFLKRLQLNATCTNVSQSSFNCVLVMKKLRMMKVDRTLSWHFEKKFPL